MHGDDSPLDQLNEKFDEVKRELQEYATAIGARHDALEKRQDHLDHRLHQLGVMIEENAQH